MKFVQLIEFKTARIDDVNALLDEWRDTTEGRAKATSSIQAADRDQPDTFISIVEFPSFEAAMENSNLPETSELAQRLAALCEGPPTFRNLDVLKDLI
jgi:hypothetical protein